MAFDMSSGFGGFGGGNGKAWPEEFISPYEAARLLCLFSSKADAFYTRCIDDNVNTLLGTLSTGKSDDFSVFSDVNEWAHFTAAISSVSAYAEYCLIEANNPENQNADKIMPALKEASNTNYVDIMSDLERVYEQVKSDLRFGRREPGIDKFLVSKDQFVEWLQHQHTKMSEGEAKIGTHEFSHILREVNAIIGIEKNRGTGWAQGQ